MICDICREKKSKRVMVFQNSSQNRKEAKSERDSRRDTTSKINGPPTQISRQPKKKKNQTKSNTNFSTISSKNVIINRPKNKKYIFTKQISAIRRIEQQTKLSEITSPTRHSTSQYDHIVSKIKTNWTNVGKKS